MKKTVMTISGIRPDFIRMSVIFKKLDTEFNHILVHTGQHYDESLSGVYFKEFNIREPDYILHAGGRNNKHYHQLGYLSTTVIELIQNKNINPDIIIFLGDSNTVCCALPLKKEGYTIGHIEAGMRSFDKNMLEEVNRIVCDHCSDIHFVYHDDYKHFLANETIHKNVHIVGNTIVEVCNPYIPTGSKRNDMILIDIHRPENFKHRHRLANVIDYANMCNKHFGIPVKMLKFGRTCDFLQQYNIDLGNIELIDLLPYTGYLETIYHCKFIISDSGTGQEEPALLHTPVIVPRDYTERPQSVKYNCSFMLDINTKANFNLSWEWIYKYYNGEIDVDVSWLGAGKTSDLIINHLHEFLNR